MVLRMRIDFWRFALKVPACSMQREIFIDSNQNFSDKI